MEILHQLSSQKGDKTEASNRIVAEKCITETELLEEIASGFSSTDKKLQSDCIEVFTMVAGNHPDLIVPWAEQILPLLTSKETKTRWEAAHTLSFIAHKIPAIIFSILAELQEIIEKDKSTIVRDYTLDTIANYAKTGKEASEKAFGILKTALEVWDEKHAKQVFIGFNHILDHQPSYGKEIDTLIRPFLDAKKKVVAKEAGKLIKRIQ